MQKVTAETLVAFIAESTSMNEPSLHEILIKEGRALHYAGIDSLDMENLNFDFRKKLGFSPAGTKVLAEYTLPEILAELERVH